MPEQKMTYAERLKAMAKKHAIKYNTGGRREYAGGPILKNDPEHMMDEAEVTVAAQAEAIREALRDWGLDENIHNHLQEHGYIEPKTE